MRILYVFAHQDDEVAVGASIARYVRDGHHVLCAYLTNGETSAASADQRNAESLSVLRRSGISAENVRFIGTALKIPDGALIAHLEEAYRELDLASFTDALPDRIFTLAWEGGHQDHDAAHLIVAALAARHDIVNRVRQFPIYHGHRVPSPFFRTLEPVQSRSTLEVEHLTFLEAWNNANLCWQYPSQRRTWIGLFPQSFLHLMLRRKLYHDAIDLQALEHRPHEGSLLYERMGRMTYDDFERYAAPFRSQFLGA